jgi:lipopolysaccharide transport system ATP-binding protein
MTEIIRVENLSKLYQLGEVGTGTLSHDLKRWWAKTRGKEDPFAKVGQLNDRTKKAGGKEYAWALQNVHFSVSQGDVVGVIGKNGAGKSTLLKILSRITSPTSGQVKIKGRIGSLLEVGTGFHPEMTGRENVYMNGTILGMRKSEITHKFDEIVDFAGVAKYIDTPVKRYSSGMMVRLGFAVAAFLEPEILIVDEVLAVGDAEFQKKAMGKMQDVTKEGRTVLFVSHNLSAVQSLCNNALLFTNGKLELMGPTHQVIEHYISTMSNDTLARLDQRTDRSGSGNVRFKNVWHKSNTELTTSGSDVSLCIEIDNAVNCESEDLRIDVGIDTVFGERVAWMSSRTSLAAGVHSPQLIEFVLPKCNLVSGRYALTLYCEVKGVLADWIKQAYFFDVYEGDYYGLKDQYFNMAGTAKFLLDYKCNFK